MESYFYKLYSGCVDSRIKLDLNLNDKTFVMEIYRGGMANKIIQDNVKGNIMVQNDTYYYLYATSYNDIDCKLKGIINKDNTILSFIFTKLQSDVTIDEHFIEFDGMVMGGCEVNKEAKYNALLIFCIGDKFGAYQPDKNNELFTNIQIMSGIYPMLKCESSDDSVVF